jgi:WhiB family transcriptional regulator, redox-sensing transcriptional regulator
MEDNMGTETPEAVRYLVSLAGQRGGWQELALCAQVDPELFFPDKGESSRPAKRVCGACEVRAECLHDALDRGERFGVWGGLSERERRVLERERRALAGRPSPVRCCPAHGVELSGGPVLYHCPSGRLGHGVTAADLAEAAGAAMLRRAAS